MEFLGLAIIVGLGVVIWNARRVSKKKFALGPQISLSNITWDPPLGQNIKSYEPITVTFDYHYSNSEEPLYIWAKVNSEELNYSYEGSHNTLQPGKGTISRYVYLKQAGQINEINIEVKNQSFKVVFSQIIDVSYIVSPNPEREALANDGQGSEITSVSFSVPEGGTLKAGDVVYVDIGYDIDATAGLDIWAVPVTDCQMTYEGTTGKVNGKGVITKSFQVSEPCLLETVNLVMENAAGETVFIREVEVKIQYESVI